MKITEVTVRPNENGNLKGFASVTFDDAIAVHGIKIIQGDSGLFVAMPSRKNANGDYVDVVHPINSDARGVLQSAILSAYEKKIAEG